MRKKKNQIIVGSITCLAEIGILLAGTLGVSLSEKNIFYFWGLTMLIPALFAVVYGIVISKKNKMSEVIWKIIPVTIILAASACSSMFYMYHGGYISDMVINTKTGNGVVLNVNDSISIGSVIQMILVLFVCALAGSAVGNKLTGMMSKIRN